MIPLWLALTLAPPPPAAPAPLRVYESETVHVGVRPAWLLTPEEVGVGITIQVSVYTYRLP